MTERTWPTPEYTHATWQEHCADTNRARKKGKIPPEPGTLAECRAVDPALFAEIEAILNRKLEEEYRQRIWLLEKQAKKTAAHPIPGLKPTRIPQYIGAVARAVSTEALTAAQGNGLLYAAQVMISLMRAQQPPPPPTRPVGFKTPQKGPTP